MIYWCTRAVRVCLGCPEGVAGQVAYRHTWMRCSTASEDGLVTSELGVQMCRTWYTSLSLTAHSWRETRSSLRHRKKARRYDFLGGRGHAHYQTYCHMNHGASHA